MKIGNKQIIIIVSVVVVLLIIAFYLTYSSGKKSNKASSLEITDDIVGTTILSDEKKQELKALAISIHHDMDGANWNWEKNLYMSANLLSDSELNALSNIFNAMYEVNSQETFLQWLKDEKFFWNDMSLQTEVNVLIKRMEGIGIS